MSLRRPLVIAFLLVVPLAFAQDQVVRVSRSVGVAEIEIPGRGWLQAVSGRALPEGGSVSTWVGAELDISGTGMELELGQLALVELVAMDEGAIGALPSFTIRVLAGAVGVRATGATVMVLTDRAELALADEGRLLYADGIVSLEDGTMSVRYRRGGDRSVVSPARIDLRELRVEPLIERPSPRH